MNTKNQKIIDWLLENKNPAVKYRTQTEILGEPGDKASIIEYLNKSLPADWREREGLWSTYYLTAVAECGLTAEDFPINKEKAVDFGEKYQFGHSCGDYMRLRALIRLGFENDPKIAEIIRNLPSKQLPDGGFLCLHRIDKLKRTPKSCVKANMHALMFCAECRKKGIETEIEAPLINYFRNHNIFYRTDDLDALMLQAREGWRTIDTFHPFEVMRVGLHNVVEAFCALGYANDPMLREAWTLLNAKSTPNGTIMDQTSTKPYLPKERAGKPGKWVTFYTLLAEKEKL